MLAWTGKLQAQDVLKGALLAVCSGPGGAASTAAAPRPACPAAHMPAHCPSQELALSALPGPHPPSLRCPGASNLPGPTDGGWQELLQQTEPLAEFLAAFVEAPDGSQGAPCPPAFAVVGAPEERWRQTGARLALRPALPCLPCLLLRLPCPGGLEGVAPQIVRGPVRALKMPAAAPAPPRPRSFCAAPH